MIKRDDERRRRERFTEFSMHTDLEDAYRKECVSSIKRLAADAHRPSLPRASQICSYTLAPLGSPLNNRIDVKPRSNHAA